MGEENMSKMYSVLILLVYCNISIAHCDLSRFRWECDLPPTTKPHLHSYALVYCGNTPVYLNQRQYDLLTHYIRSNINMVLKLNGEYLDAPCLPAERFLSFP